MIWYCRDVWVLLFLGSDTGQNLHATHIQMRKWRKYKDEEVENFCDEIEQSIDALIWCEEVLVSIDIIDIVSLLLLYVSSEWIIEILFYWNREFCTHLQANAIAMFLNIVHCYILLLWMLCIIYLNTLRAFLLTFLQLWCTRAGVTCQCAKMQRVSHLTSLHWHCHLIVTNASAGKWSYYSKARSDVTLIDIIVHCDHINCYKKVVVFQRQNCIILTSMDL